MSDYSLHYDNEYIDDNNGLTNNSKLGSPSNTSAVNGVLSRIAQITSKSFKRSINVAGSLK